MRTNPTPLEYTTDEAARLSGLNRSTLKTWCQRGVIAPSATEHDPARQRQRQRYGGGDVLALRVGAELLAVGVAAPLIGRVMAFVQRLASEQGLERLSRTSIATAGGEICAFQGPEVPKMNRGLVLVVSLAPLMQGLTDLMAAA